MRRVTIGVPAYNEEQNILNFLQSLEDQHARDIAITEVIISDDSSDRTAEIVNRFAMHSSLNIVLLHHDTRRGAATAWNEIFNQAAGDVIVLFDADTIPHPSCVEQLITGLGGNTSLCASNSQPVQAAGIAGRASVFISNWLRSVRLTGLSQYTVMGRALAIDSVIAKRIQIPSDIIAIDLYLQCRVLEAGLNVAYNDNAIIYFRPANSMEDLASQVIRAVNGHMQIRDYVSRFKINLPPKVAIAQAVKNAMADPAGALSVALGYSMVPYYRSTLTQTNSAKWQSVQSSKSIDYQQLKTQF
ncbi:MAG TPA: glycosyltransferase family 2 protein [Nitrososphaera sp.]|nr:glycosyltransferase family 2 protein [Nitrososphaera sp.]